MTSTDSTSASLPDHGAGPDRPGSLILVLNNCEDRLQLVLGEDSDSDVLLLSSRELVVPGRTMAFLVPAISEMLAEQQREVADIGRIACTRGPGSFTGIRLALSTALGLQGGCGALMAGLDYLPLVAAAVLPQTSQPTFVLTYARRGQVYLQGFAPTGTQLTPVMPMSARDAAATIAQTDGPAILLGTGLHKNFETFAPLATQGTLMLGPVWSHPKPEILLAAAAKAAYSVEPPEPAYGRNADAEDNLDEISKQRGVDPAEARRILKECRRG